MLDSDVSTRRERVFVFVLMWTHTDLQAPHTRRVVQSRVQFSCPAGVSQVSNVPNINTVVVVDTGQPAVCGVIGHGYRVRVPSLRPAGEQLTVGGGGESRVWDLTQTSIKLKTKPADVSVVSMVTCQLTSESKPDSGFLFYISPPGSTGATCGLELSKSTIVVLPVRYCVCVTCQVCALPGVHHTGNVSSQVVWAGKSAEEVQVDGTESSNGPIGTTTEDQLVCDGQTGGLRRLRTQIESNLHCSW